MTAAGLGERSVVRLRGHAARLTGPALVLVALSGLTGLGLGWANGRAAWVSGVVAGLGGLAVLRWCVLPFVRWWTTTYELTTRRLSMRWGLLSRHGRDLPLRRVVDVALDRSLAERLVGAGTLTVHTAGDDEPLVLARMPQPERLHRTLVGLLDDVAGFADDRDDAADEPDEEGWA